MKYETFEDLITKFQLYEKFEVQLLKDSNSPNKPLTKDAQLLFNLLFNTAKVNLMCVDCKKEYPFDVSHTLDKAYRDFHYKVMQYGMDYYDDIDNPRLINGIKEPPSYDTGVIRFTFKCNMIPQHHFYKMYLLYELNDNTLSIRKIGQKPSTGDLVEKYSNHYESILKKYDALDDYKKYEQSRDRGLLAGACTYLRRIFEKMVNVMLNAKGLTNEQLKALEHFDDKVKEVKDQFDPEIRDVLNTTYSLLSKGIHELNNDEIDNLYKLMAEVINVQLEFEKEANYRKARLKELRADINKEHSKKS